MYDLLKNIFKKPVTEKSIDSFAKSSEEFYSVLNYVDSPKVNDFIYGLSKRIGCEYSIFGLFDDVTSKDSINLCVVPEIPLKRDTIENCITKAVEDMSLKTKALESLEYCDDIFPYMKKSITVDIGCSKELNIYLGKEDISRKYDDKVSDLNKESKKFSVLYRSRYFSEKFNV